MRKWLLLFILLLPLSTLGAKGSREAEPQPIREPLESADTFVVALLKSEDPPYLNPVEATDATSILVLDGMFEGLYAFDPKTAQPVAAIAQAVEISEDGLQWTFTLDKRARFSNGEPIDAMTFLDSWLWLLDSASQESGNTSLASMFDCVVGVKEYREGSGSRSSVGIRAKSSHQLQISLRTAAPYLPALLATLPFSAIHESMRDHRTAMEPSGIIGSGPYVVRSADTEGVLLAKHPWYRDYGAVPSDFIQFRFLDQMEIIQAYLERSIHWSLAFIPPTLLRDKSDLHISPEYSTGFYYFSAKSGAYANPQVRKALAMLIPWNELRRDSGQIFPTDRLIPGMTGIPDDLPQQSSEPEGEALALLAAEGFPYGAGLPTLNMAVHRGSQVLGSARRIADIWSQELGITVILDVVPLGMYSRFPSLSPYDFAFITWIGDIHDPFAFLHLWTSESGYNLGNHSDPAFDALVAAASEATDERQRQDLARIAEEHLLDSATVFPLYHGITTNIIDASTVTGWHDNILNIHPVRHLGTKQF